MNRKLQYIAAITAGAFLFCAARAAADTKVMLFSADTPTKSVQYLVPESRFLSATNAWNPHLSAFPSEIRDFSEKAKTHLLEKRKIIGTIALASVRMDLRRQRDSNFQMVERWVIHLQFDHEHPNGNVRPVEFPVIMLLDGTIAEEVSVNRLSP